jgi:LacI family transcriptional regulator
MDKAKIRIKDITEQDDVSVGTVDRVLHNRGEVAEET